MKNCSLIAIVVMVLTVVSTVAAQQSSSDQNMPTDKAFITKAAEINLGEVELGRMTEQKGNNQAVKDFGQRMIEDHTNAESQLQQLAKQEGVMLPSQPGSAATNLHQQLSSVSGAQFDEMYIDHMLAGHKGAITVFENEIEHGQNPAIRAFAESVLPVIQDHVRIAEDVAGKMDLAGRQGLEDPSKAITAPATPK
jgi:putative membrane protein